MFDYDVVDGVVVERRVPWYNLGTNVEECTTSQDAIIKAGLNWTVSSEDVYVNNELVPQYKANVKSDDHRVLGMVSPKYQIVQNAEAFDFTNNLVKEGVQFINAGMTKLGKLVWLLAKLPESSILDDVVEPYIVFTNTHDGTGSIRVAMTPIRVACSNALNMAFKEAARAWSTRHMGDLTSKLFEAKSSLENAHKYMKVLNTTADHMANNTITDVEVLQLIAKLFPLSTDMSDRQQENVKLRRKEFLRCYAADDIAKFKNTEWGVLNAAADFATHGISLRNTDSGAERQWLSVMNGANVLDLTTKLLENRKAA